MEHSTFREARQAFDKGETNSETLVSSFFEKIDASNEELNIFLHLDREDAHAQARIIDQKVQGGASLPLAGMVMGVKDVICLKDKQVTCGSRMLEGFTSLYDATVIERLQEAGAIIVGKTNCDEFAMGSSNENSAFGPVKNPHNPEYVPGGSSGGSAAAVAATMCHTSLGSDTGGSIRQPAAFCGVVGLKPTYGRVSRYGLVAYASSLDCIGPFGHTVEDVADVLGVIAGRDPNDSTSADVPVDDYRAALTGSVEGVRVGLPVEYYAEGLDGEIRKLIDLQVKELEKAGAIISEVSLPYTDYGIAAYYVLATAEASSNLARYDGVRYGHRADVDAVRADVKERQRVLEKQISDARKGGDPLRIEELEKEMRIQPSLLEEVYARTRTEGFGKEVKQRILLGTYVLSAGYYDAYYGKAQQVRSLIRHDFETAFNDVDVLITPATPRPPFKLNSKVDDPLAMYLEDIYTVTANLAGIPGLVVPIGNHSIGLPVGMQLLGRHFEESLLLQVGDVVMRNQ